jgi:two-component system LytT family response regulator
MSFRTLIVDDEPIARQILREELEFLPGVELIGEADSGVSALDQIAARKPDLVLLDLQMPQMGGFEVVRNLRAGSHMPAIIIVTAYDEYALRAFDEGAVDYLLKPVSQHRLFEAVERAKRTSDKRRDIADPPAQSPPKKIVGKLGEEYFLLSSEEILAFQADGDLVWIMTVRRKYLATLTLKVLEERLANSSFRRIHRGALVNIDHVRKMSALTSQRWLITLSNNQEFIASKRLARSVRDILNR